MSISAIAATSNPQPGVFPDPSMDGAFPLATNESPLPMTSGQSAISNDGIGAPGSGGSSGLYGGPGQ